MRPEHAWRQTPHAGAALRSAGLLAWCALLSVACGGGGGADGGVDAGRAAGLPDGSLALGTTAVRTATTTLGGREVVLFYPAFPFQPGDAGLLLLNDGQDVDALGVATRLDQAWTAGTLRPLVVVAIPAGDRLQEYGTAEDGGSIACLPSATEGPYGTRAAEYEAFLAERLLPEAWAMLAARPPPARTGFLGASLGGLSAFSTAWGHPGVFGYAGVLSGSFWWRTNPGTVQERQDSRIMRNIVARSAPRPGFRAWFEAGTADETSDRNGNGVIDAIEDTQDLLAALAGVGVVGAVYREVPGGTHGYATWAAVLPEFLVWAAPP